MNSGCEFVSRNESYGATARSFKDEWDGWHSAVIMTFNNDAASVDNALYPLLRVRLIWQLMHSRCHRLHRLNVQRQSRGHKCVTIASVTLPTASPTASQIQVPSVSLYSPRYTIRYRHISLLTPAMESERICECRRLSEACCYTLPFPSCRSVALRFHTLRLLLCE